VIHIANSNYDLKLHKLRIELKLDSVLAKTDLIWFYDCKRGSSVQHSTVQYSTVQYSTVQYSTVQYSTYNIKFLHPGYLPQQISAHSVQSFGRL